MPRQSCAVCAWRENCSKRFCIPDSGSRCPDFSRDVTIKSDPDDTDITTNQKE
ncbi:MAG: hypothetical protein HIU83_10590 [Proteobacteria bacterium]|nr:hypothetical protein [Pseudomonadota bacterium]